MLRPLLAIALKDLKLLLRNRGACFFTFAWPLGVAILFGLIFGGGGKKGKLKLALADEDRSPAAQAFVAGLAAADEFSAVALPRAEALEKVRRGELTAAVIVPAGYGAASGRLFHGEPPRVELWMDPARGAERAMLEGLLQRQAARRLSAMVSDPAVGAETVANARRDMADADPKTRADLAPLIDGLDHYLQRERPAAAPPGSAASAPAPAPGWSPLTVEAHEAAVKRNGPRSAFEFSFPQGILWGLLGATMSFATGLATERTTGTLLRLRVAPLSPGRLLAGKGLGGFLGLLISQALLLGVGALLFKVRAAQPLLLLAAVLSVACCFTGLMLFIATLGRNEQAVSGAGWAVLMPLTMIGGGTIPLFAMPAWLATASHLSPMKWTVLALEGALWRGFSPAEMLRPCAILIGVGLVAGWLGSRVVRDA